MTNNEFTNTGVRPVAEDAGRQEVTGNPADRGRFRVPSTRNVALRAPYFHNGAARTLTDVVDFYNRGGNFRDNLDRRVRPLGLSPQMRADLVSFMQALTDPRVANETAPFDRPTLYTETIRVPAILGAGTAGTGGSVPVMVAEQPPFLGNPSFTLGVTGGLGGANSLVLFDMDAQMQPIALLGIQLHLPLSGGLMVVAGGALQGQGAGQGFHSLSVAVPAMGQLIGATVGAQWVLVDPGQGGQFSASPAARIRVF